MTGGALVGLDVGSTMVKAAVFDSSGRLITWASRSVPVIQLQPSWMERDVEATWRAAAAVLRAVASRVRKVTAVGITGCGNGAVLVGFRGNVLRHGILSGDTRAADLVAIRRRSSYERPFPGQTACLVRWLEAHEPAVLKRATALLFWKDFIRLRLTDKICTDYTDAGASGLFDFKNLKWRASHSFLPPVQGSSAAAGVITATASERVGIPAGTPVFTGVIDCEAAALGSGVFDEGDLSVVAGTWSINQSYSRKPLKTVDLFLCNLSAHFGRWLLLEGGPGSSANFEWAVRTLQGRPDLGRALRLAASTRRSNLLFVPGVASGRGIFAGLDQSHCAGDLLRAVMEGVVYSHRVQIEKLAIASSSFKRVRFAGGASRSTLWCQLFADGLGLPVEVPRGAELGALGAALCAGVGVGRWSSLHEAQRATVRILRTFMPAADAREPTVRAYRRFKEISLNLSSS